MKLQWGRRGDNLYIYLSGELDEHSVAGVRGEADKLIDENAGLSRAVFNLAGLKFMDSTGIGFLIGRYKRLKKYGMGMYLESPEDNADKILSLSGLYSLMPKI
ncbi:MAG: anti-sigma factor antagonist [Clostridia bacterium]|nr:anti-sigma factor antagonist [Clostridia bacterium]